MVYTDIAHDCSCATIVHRLAHLTNPTREILGECGWCGGRVVDTGFTVDIGPEGINIHECLDCGSVYHA